MCIRDRHHRLVEDHVVPSCLERVELPVLEARLAIAEERQLQRSVRLAHHHVAVQRVRIRPRVRREWQRRAGVLRAFPLCLGHRVGAGLLERRHLRRDLAGPVPLGCAEEAVEQVALQHLRRHGRQVREDHEPQPFLRYERDFRGHPVDPAGMLHDRATVPAVEHPCHSVGDELRPGRREFAERGGRHRHVRAAGIIERRLVEQLAAVPLSLRQLEADPLRHVVHARVDRAGGGDVVDVPIGNAPHRPVALEMRLRHVGHGSQLAHRRPRRAHPERGEEARLHCVVPAAPVHRRDHLPRGEEHLVLVLPRRTEGGAGLAIAQAPQDLLARVRRPVPDGVGRRQPAAVRDQVADGEFARDVGIVQLQ